MMLLADTVCIKEQILHHYTYGRKKVTFLMWEIFHMFDGPRDEKTGNSSQPKTGSRQYCQSSTAPVSPHVLCIRIFNGELSSLIDGITTNFQKPITQ